MVNSEIDSFVAQFRSLWSAGYQATLNLESNLGEVSITLNCKVGRNDPPEVLSPSPILLHSKHRSPSYFRRQARRKAERDAVINSFMDVSSPITEKVLKDASIQTLEEAEMTADYINVECSSAEEVQVHSTENCEEMEYIDKDELQRDKLVEDIFVYAVPPSDCIPSIPDASEVDQEIREWFSCLGIQARDIRIQTRKHGKY